MPDRHELAIAGVVPGEVGGAFRLAGGFAMALVLLVPLPCPGQEDPAIEEPEEIEVPPAERHWGFFFRVAGGLGFSGAVEAGSGHRASLDGFAALQNFSVGGTVAENLVLSFDASAAEYLDPIAFVDGEEQEDITVHIAHVSVGLGATYYFMPENVYLAVSLGLSKIDSSNPTWPYPYIQTWRSRLGWGVTAMAGKEWWVEKDWGCGAGFLAMLTGLPKGSHETWLLAFSAGAFFSTTYN